MARILLLALVFLLSTHVSAITIQWIPLGPTTPVGNPGTIAGNPVLEYKNAGKDGIDWVATGAGPRGGMGVEELWLFDNSANPETPGTSEAVTTFSVASNSVSFILQGDHNDGFAQFFVDGIDISPFYYDIGTSCPSGTVTIDGIDICPFDLLQRGRTNLVVTGLDFKTHSLKIVQLGMHHPDAKKGDVAIIGGAAFNTAFNSAITISEPPILGLFFISFLYFLGCFMKKIYNANRLSFVSVKMAKLD